jgi:sugar O-acyltransferase (sialic acid O-acetyltransferase NeuD family)
MRDIVIVGAGGFAREALDVIEAVSASREMAGEGWRFIGFLDDGRPNTYGRGPIIGPLSDLDRLQVSYVIGIGNPRVRKRVDESADLEAAVLVHPDATLGPDVELGPGSIVTAGVRMTSHIRIGRHVHLNLNSTVGHDAVLHDYVTVNPLAAISGEVTLLEGVTIGTNGAVNQQRTVGAWTIVGAGAVVVKDLPPNIVATGVPARARQ